MTNREKYKEEILDIVCAGQSIALDRTQRKLVPCVKLPCAKCEFFENPRTGTCGTTKREWYNSKYKEPEIDWSKVEVDTPILVTDCLTEASWSKRYFAKYKCGVVYTWAGGRTSRSANSENDITKWDFAKLAESEE